MLVITGAAVEKVQEMKKYFDRMDEIKPPKPLNGDE